MALWQLDSELSSVMVLFEQSSCLFSHSPINSLILAKTDGKSNHFNQTFWIISISQSRKRKRYSEFDSESEANKKQWEYWQSCQVGAGVTGLSYPLDELTEGKFILTVHIQDELTLGKFILKNTGICVRTRVS